MRHMGSNDCDEDTVPIQTIGDLRKLIELCPDNMKVHLWDVGIGGTVYHVCAGVRKQDCIEHNGKKWTAEGLMIEVD